MDAVDDEVELIVSYASRKTDVVIDMIIDSLRQCGFEAYRGVILPGDLVNIQRGKFKGFIDVRRTLLEIATEEGKGEKFDRNLANPSYEMVKIMTILQLRLKVVIAAFTAQDEQERSDRLLEMTRTTENLVIHVRSAVKE